jgi:predicted N-acyltransferase
MKNNKTLGARIFKSASQINKAEWDGVFPAIAESYNFFKTLDETLQRQFKHRYICIYEEDRLVCLAPCFIMDYPLETTVEGFLKRAALRIKAVFPKLLTLPALICGCAAAEGRVGFKDITRPDIREFLVSAIFSLAKSEHLNFVAFKDFTDEYGLLFTTLEKSGFHKIHSYPAVELDIRFDSFEAYLSSLSRITRKGLLRNFREVEKLPALQMETTNALGSLLDEAYELYLNTLKKSDVQFEMLSKDFFRVISQNAPDETRYFLWKLSGKLVAFDLCLLSNNILVDEYIGLDYAYAYKYHLYYLTFRDIMLWCIKNGVKTYESGALNYDPKKRLDFKFIPQSFLVRHSNPVLNFFLGFLCLVLKPENFDPILKEMNRKKR